MMSERDLKTVFFENLFSNGECSNRQYKAFIEDLVMKYPKSREEIMSEVMFHSYEAIMDFTIRDGGCWEEVLMEKDKVNLGRLFSTMKKRVGHEVYKWANEIVLTKGKDQTTHLMVKKEYGSIDLDIEGVPLIELLTHSFWEPGLPSQANSFLSWFRENRESFLTKNQVQLLNNLERASHEKDGYTEDDVEAITGKSKKNLARYFDTISKRTLAAWESSKREVRNNSELELLEQFSTIEKVEQIPIWIRMNIDRTYIGNLLYDNLTGKDGVELVKLLKNEEHESYIIYKAIHLLNTRLDKLKEEPIVAVPFYKKREEMGQYTPEKLSEVKAAHKKAMEPSDVKVYCMRTGELKRIEPAYKPTNINKSKIVEPTSQGLRELGSF